MDQDMGQPDQIDSHQIDSSKLENKLEDMFDNMQITVMGQDQKGEDSDDFVEDGDDGSDEEGEAESHFQEDLNKISYKHQKHTDLEARDRDDMDFPDEVDTPLNEARKRF